MESLNGRLLVASPTLLGEFFAGTVILVLEHNEEGAMGVVLNRLTEATVNDIADQIFEEPIEWDKPIHLGGPVRGPLQILHDRPEFADREIVDGVRCTVGAEEVRELIVAKPEPSLVLANYAGWGTGQLEGEIAEGSWLSTPARAELVFYADTIDLWKVVLNEIRAAELSHVLRIKLPKNDPRLN